MHRAQAVMQGFDKLSTVKAEINIFERSMGSKLHHYILILFLLAFSACRNEKSERPPILTNENIETQLFIIQGNKDTILTGKSGTILTIQKNTFANQKGDFILDNIKIELKECLTKFDMVIGNLTTTSNGKLLESGGMIYVNATSNDQQLNLATNKTIGVELPVDSILSGMQLFEGILDFNSINWVNPEPLIPNEVQDLQSTVQVNATPDSIIKRHNVAYNFDEFPNDSSKIPNNLANKINELIFDGTGLILTRDSNVVIEGYKVKLYKLDTLYEWVEYESGDIWGSNGNLNLFSEDNKTKYLFSLQKLGWANIDRFYSDPRTKEVELIVNINDAGQFDNIYTSMIFKSQSVYLAGYQKEDGSFSFTHGDYEKTSLPVAEITTLLVTGYQAENPFFAIKTFAIEEIQTIDLILSETTVDNLKKEIKNNL